MVAGIIRQLARCIPRCSVIEKLKTMWHRLLLLASPVVAGTAHCLLASPVVVDIARGSRDWVLLLALRVVAAVARAITWCCCHRPWLLASCVVAGITCDC